MSCKICKSSQPCGCKDTPLSIPPNYVTDPTVCPDPTPCSEIFDSQCICYSGDLLECGGQSWTIPPGTDVQTVIQTLFNALCEVATTVAPGIGYNITAPQLESGDNTAADLGILSTTGDPTVFSDSDRTNLVDRIGCADDIIVTVTWTDVLLDEIYFDTPGTTNVTIPSGNSLVISDVGIKFLVAPAPGYTGSFTVTYVSCGITKIQTWNYEIP